MIEATLARPEISAAGITITHRTPTLALCRALVDAGHPDQPMTVTDAATGKPVLNVPSIHAAAGLTVVESASAGPKFAKFTPFPESVRGEE
jgi:hypothetical protein